MAFIDLRSAPLPTVHRTTAVDTPWQGYKVPPRCRITITVVGEDGMLAFASNGNPSGTPEVPADGGAVGTHYEPLVQDVPTLVRMGPASGAAPSGVFYVARSATAGAVIVRLEQL